MKKLLIIGIIFLFSCTGVSSFAYANGKMPKPMTSGSILYVGGSGPGNYTKIQDAINASVEEDTVFVYSGVYHEKLWIFTAIRLIGESKNTTYINMTFYSDNDALIDIGSSNVTITGFTLNATVGGKYYCRLLYSSFKNNLDVLGNIIRGNVSLGIDFTDCNDCCITDNSFYSISEGINIQIVMNNTITSNIFNDSGIHVIQGQHLTIENNLITNTYIGLNLIDTSFSTISNNTFFNIIGSLGLAGQQRCIDDIISHNSIDNPTPRIHGINYYGIAIGVNAENTTITQNLVRHCSYGIFLYYSSNTTVSKNTIQFNRINARFNSTKNDVWDQNYWGRPRLLPKIIFGTNGNSQISPNLEFDWHPAMKPYDILVIN